MVIINNSISHGLSISLKFGAAFDQVTRCTTIVQGQVSEVKAIASKRLIAKLLHSFRKSRNLMAISEFLIGSRAISVYAHALYTTDQKQPTTTGATSRGLQVAMHL